jgi:multiple sugar transport system permease protein
MNEKKKQALINNISGWLIILPSFILFCFYIWVPLIESIRLSLYRTQGIRLIEFVGLENYRVVLGHPDFMPAIINTFMYTVWSLVIGFIVPIILAVLINETVRGKAFFRVATYFPTIIPGLATVLMLRYFFVAGDTGVMNILLSQFGVEPQAWLSNSAIVVPLIVVIMTWRSAGSTSLLYMAGLSNVNTELYEAAIIDGAGIWARIRYITLPLIYNLGSTMLILQIIAVFQILYEPQVLTNGGPNNASISIMLLVFRYAFERFDYPKAAAVSVLVSLILIVLTTIYLRVNKRRDY